MPLPCLYRIAQSLREVRRIRHSAPCGGGALPDLCAQTPRREPLEMMCISYGQCTCFTQLVRAWQHHTCHVLYDVLCRQNLAVTAARWQGRSGRRDSAPEERHPHRCACHQALLMLGSVVPDQHKSPGVGEGVGSGCLIKAQAADQLLSSCYPAQLLSSSVRSSYLPSHSPTICGGTASSSGAR